MPSIDERLALLSGLQVLRDRIAAARKREEEARELRFAAENDFEHAWSALMGQTAPPPAAQPAPAPAQPLTLSPLAAQSAPPGTVVSLEPRQEVSEPDLFTSSCSTPPGGTRKEGAA
jgi:hypothetical protein